MIGFNGEEIPIRRKVKERSIGFIDERVPNTFSLSSGRLKCIREESLRGWHILKKNYCPAYAAT
jgi:hypothetical protein